MKLSQKINTSLLKFVLAIGFGFFLFSLPATVQAASNGNGDNCKNTTSAAALENCIRNNKITKDLNYIINFLSAGVGIVIVGMLLVGGIQYMVAGANPQALTAAKARISNALIALLAFIFTFAFLQWLVPGGIFG